MKMQAAVVKEQGVTFAVVMVRQEVTMYSVRAIKARNELSRVFKVPVILLSFDNNNQPHYYGRKDIVEFLKSIRVEQIPFRQYDLVPVY